MNILTHGFDTLNKEIQGVSTVTDGVLHIEAGVGQASTRSYYFDCAKSDFVSVSCVGKAVSGKGGLAIDFYKATGTFYESQHVTFENRQFAPIHAVFDVPNDAVFARVVFGIWGFALEQSEIEYKYPSIQVSKTHTVPVIESAIIACRSGIFSIDYINKPCGVESVEWDSTTKTLNIFVTKRYGLGDKPYPMLIAQNISNSSPTDMYVVDNHVPPGVRSETRVQLQWYTPAGVLIDVPASGINRYVLVQIIR